MENEVKLISEKQASFLLGLCKRKRISPPVGYDKWTSAQASAEIERLNSNVVTAQKVVEQVQAVKEERVQRDSERVQSQPVQTLDKATVGMCYKKVRDVWMHENRNVQSAKEQFIREVCEEVALIKAINTELVKLEFGASPLILPFKTNYTPERQLNICPGCGAIENDECDKECTSKLAKEHLKQVAMNGRTYNP